jgi:hypothetical protein
MEANRSAQRTWKKAYLLSRASRLLEREVPWNAALLQIFPTLSSYNWW